MDQDIMSAKRANLPRTATTSRKELHTEVRFDKERNITQDHNIAQKKVIWRLIIVFCQ